MRICVRTTFCAFAIAALAVAASAGEWIDLGKSLSDAETIAIGELLSHPDRYVDKVVKVEGEITDVCPKAGCWVDIADGEKKIRFKVKDYEIVFEAENIGHGVIAEGLFTKVEMSRKDAESYGRHLAEEKGEKFDPSTIDSLMGQLPHPGNRSPSHRNPRPLTRSLRTDVPNPTPSRAGTLNAPAQPRHRTQNHQASPSSATR